MVRLHLGFWVYQCASCVFADRTGRDESRAIVVSTFLQSFRPGKRDVLNKSSKFMLCPFRDYNKTLKT